LMCPFWLSHNISSNKGTSFWDTRYIYFLGLYLYWIRDTL